ncbi:MAG: class I SAM-dependent DNA methyltransferase [Acidimicrobiia bacterium]|nr:class I SAM-dependent DNA methyltransferase [Acidimicrobiia bacterium]
MPLSGEEIRRRLAAFAKDWKDYAGTERSEAQTFLNQLLECYGTDRKGVGAHFEELTPAGGFMDMIWPRVCIVEMKRPEESSRLLAHRRQALDYWQRSGTPQIPAPRYVVVCSFHRFEVFEPGAVYTEPMAEFGIEELPERQDALLFLAGGSPVFTGARSELTREAVVLVTDVYRSLRERSAADLDTLRDFILQTVWSLFAEDFQMLPSMLFTRLLDGLIAGGDSRSSEEELGQLFRYLAIREPRPSDRSPYAGTPYANGGLFERPAAVHLEPGELQLLRYAADFDWKRVEPAIFGNLLQGALGRDRQWALGAHYTSEADIRRVVEPTIVDPWRERVEATTTLKQVRELQQDLTTYTVLDPACGSGNFLYVAYRELRRIEAALRRREADMLRAAGKAEQASMSLFFPLANMRGIELDPFAVDLARVTLWMAQKLAVEELDIPEEPLPLADLSGIRRGDALRMQWPRADAIVGNPPYHGSQRVRKELGDDYAEWLRHEFGIGLKDYAVYWFRKAHERLEPGGRAGLVATNSVTQNRNREPSLTWIVETGGVITDAISTQDWSGEAAVDVSIVNWVMEPAAPPATTSLDGVVVEGITPALRATGSDASRAVALPANSGLSFQGPMPVGRGFVLERAEAEALLARTDADYRLVVRPYLVGEDIAVSLDQGPSRFVIDFAVRPLEDAMQFPAALDVLRRTVKAERERNRDRFRREHWWLLGRPVIAMRQALAPLGRYIAGTATGKRILFAWQDPWTCPSNAMMRSPSLMTTRWECSPQRSMANGREPSHPPLKTGSATRQLRPLRPFPGHSPTNRHERASANSPAA